MNDGIETKLGSIDARLGNIEKVLDKVPCLDPEKGPLTDIKNLKQDMALIKRIGGTITTGLILGLGWAWKRLINGG